MSHDSPTIPEGRVTAPKKSKKAAIWKGVGSALGIIAAAAALAFSQSYSANASQAHAPRHEPVTVEEKIDAMRDELRTGLQDVRAEQSNQSRDIAVIKRQLGLDGLGPPPGVARSGIGR